MTPEETKILVVDDDDAGRYLKAHILRKHGYIVAEADRGEVALAKCREDTPDLVVLDTRLPDISGTEVCRQIKAAYPHVAVLQTSAAMGGPAARTEALEGGADTFLVEPVEPDELLASAKALLRMRHAEQELRDINERLEELVAERTAELADANRRLDIESAERRKAEEVLWHAQKLEAVGQLTGGIAHDFNNLLAVIVGSLAMLRASAEGRRRYPQEKILRLLGAAETAADRGAKLTQQMLAFARRSVLTSETVIIDEVLAACESFLRRALGETITLDLAYTADAWSCRIDPVQFESAILNLAVNARDAMPDGGKLVIRTSNLTIDGSAAHVPDAPGEGAYVYVEVADSGTGMEAEVAQRAFEPFFTTKDVGKGTGLGLSQVYGFVTQSGGHITIDSAVGEGTTFRIYLPRSTAPVPVPEAAAGDGVAAEAGGGDETILVVEDNAGVLELAVMTISDLGYNVLSAQNGVEALKIMKSTEKVDLLFSDVVMPGGLNGFELVRQARQMRRGLKALVTTGYANVRNDGDFPLLAILPKPYARHDLALKLRQILDG